MEELLKVVLALLGPKGPATPRAQVEREVKDDLNKPYEQLLVDAHEELLHWDWPALERIIHSQKRIASLEVRIAQNADEQLKEIKRLTARVDRLTIALVLIGIATLVVEVVK